MKGQKGEKAQLGKGGKRAPPPASTAAPSSSAGKGLIGTKGVGRPPPPAVQPKTGGKTRPAVHPKTRRKSRRKSRRSSPATHPKTGGKTPQYTAQVRNQIGRFYTPGNYLPVKDQPIITPRKQEKERKRQVKHQLDHLENVMPVFTRKEFE
jgi:hypothetical protein